MARAKVAPKGTDPDDKQLTIPHKDFMEYQNKIASALNVFHSMATTYQQFANSNMNAVTGTMNLVQSYTKQVTNNNSIDDAAAGVEEYPELVKMFGANKPAGDGFGMFAEGMMANVSKALLPVDTKPVKTKRVKKPKDPNAPTRPVTAYFLYIEQNREKIAKTLGSDATKGDIQNKCTEHWRELPDSEKEKYKAQYRQHFEEYKAKLAQYKAEGGRVSSEDLQQVDEDVPHTAMAVPAPLGVMVAPVEDDSSDEEEDSDDEKAKTPTPPPKKKAAAKSKKAAAPAAAEPAKETSPEKKKKSTKKAKEASPEESKKKKADGSEESKKKKRKSTATEPEAEKPSAKKKKTKSGASKMSGGSFGEDF